ncbi:MAG: transglycosylase SLT domain-containing protein [Thermoleophilia bacterium]|nr:transglycosylase SLT domain-containing protein [Thermoleophilia bacterium]
MAGHASAFGFVQRYSWEPWHFGYVPGCGTARGGPEVAGWGERAVGSAPPATPDARLPGWVPAAYRRAVAASARAGGVPPALLAALLRAESGFDPRAVSPAGARGIAQFMPATAASVGLGDPFDPEPAIAAAGRLLGAHLREFGSVPLALAAYNAGPGAVRRHGGVPPFAETRAYVARIVALTAGGASPGGGAWSTGVVLLPVPP